MMKTLNADLRYAASKAARILTVFQEVTHSPTMGIDEALTFLKVAEHDSEGITQTEIKKALGFTLASANRYVLSLSTQTKGDRSGNPGHGLIAVIPDPDDRRREPYCLTSEGCELLAQISKVLQTTPKG